MKTLFIYDPDYLDNNWIKALKHRAIVIDGLIEGETATFARTNQENIQDLISAHKKVIVWGEIPDHIMKLPKPTEDTPKYSILTNERLDK